jgi:hypothetical protein
MRRKSLNAIKMRSVFGWVIAACLFSILTNSVPASANPGNAKPPKTKITAKQAEQIALKKYPGKLTAKTELENEEGKWQFAVMVKSGKTLREVMVNANSGKIDNVEVTTKAKEAKEKADEAKAKKAKTGK